MNGRVVAALDLADNEAEAIYVLAHNAAWVRLVLPDGQEFLVDRAELHEATAADVGVRERAA